MLSNCISFSLSRFQIEVLPPELFQCKKLRTLNLGNNCLTALPSRFGELTGLMQLELRGNRLEGLPVELVECRLLKRSGLIVEEDLFNTLPPEVKEQLWKADKEQAWIGQTGWKVFSLNKKHLSFGRETDSHLTLQRWSINWTKTLLSLDTHEVKSFLYCPLQARSSMRIDNTDANVLVWVPIFNSGIIGTCGYKQYVVCELWVLGSGKRPIRSMNVPVKDIKLNVMFCKPISWFKINACFLKTIWKLNESLVNDNV